MNVKKAFSSVNMNLSWFDLCEAIYMFLFLIYLYVDKQQSH